MSDPRCPVCNSQANPGNTNGSLVFWLECEGQYYPYEHSITIYGKTKEEAEANWLRAFGGNDDRKD